MNSSSSNSNHAFRNSNETNQILGFNSPAGAAGAGLGSNVLRPRLMKMRRQTSNNPRSTPVSGSRRGEEADPGLGFNPFRTSSESIFVDSSSVNLPTTFSFGSGSSNNNPSPNLGVVDDLAKLKIDSNNSHTKDIGANAAFQFKAFENENKSSFSQPMADQLPNEINKLNIGDSGSNLGSMKNLQDVNPFKSRFNNTFGGKVDAELQHEMHKLNLGNHTNVGQDSNSLKGFVFRRSEAVNHGKQQSEDNVKVSGDRDDNLKNSVFGSNSMHSEENMKAADLISDRMRGLKVGGAGEDFVFGQNVEPKVYEATTSSNFQAFGNSYFTSRREKNTEFTFSSKLDNSRDPNVEFKTPDTKGGLFSSAKSIPEARLKKKKGKVRKPVIGQREPKQDFVFGQSSHQVSESSEAYSPMDVSPYQETLADNYSRGISVTSDDATSQINDQNSVSDESHIINSNITTDEDLIIATQRLDVNDGDVKCEASETETFKSAMENLEFSSDTFATALDSELSSTATSGNQEKSGTRIFEFGSKLENISKENFTFAASTSGQNQMSPETRKHKKKHWLKTSQDSYSSTSDAKNTYASSSTSILSPGSTQKVDMSILSSKNKDNFKPINDQDSKHGTSATASVSIAAEEVCEKWRLRGNQAYGNGDLAKAEDYYTQGLNSVSQTEKSKGCLRALMLCYSNRAATRISLGRMKDALKDCLMAAAIDPNFLKVQVRAAHCYLAIGEVENATFQYMKCLQSGSDVCVDRKLLVDASEGLEKAQKVTQCLKQYTELPRRTPEDLECALKVIDEALQISNYSEQLLQMKADTLLMLQRYEQIIPMCEQTLSSDVSDSWRLNLIVKCYFYLGRLEEAHEFIKKQESSGHITERLESMSLESMIPLADTISELLSRKAAGNEAYKSGRYSEAVENYTSALSCSVESRPFAAICFCNRAAAYRALGQISDAIADCSLAIALDPSYLKAISRRASLYEMIRDYGQAANDLRRLVSSLTSQMDKSNELRQTQIRLYNIEEESKKEIPLNMYLILGVESTAAASEVKKAYRKAALKHHPDKAALLVSRSDNGDDRLWKEISENVYKDADRLFKMIGEAYAVLSNPSKRSQYDMDEEMRNEINKFTRSSSGRMAADVQSPIFERSGSRRFPDSWRPYAYSQSKGQERWQYSRYS
ncbi:hypothetical protein L1987_61241 [Smallanthus sonchifolius]|uniref:Uncharacterized protein n=1 Tax=Smallanthus sonchifolius TaxID=185202 RepID=A0ACB9DB60_9ASTR|nr:hypothetical protein L1987_61241 [Smallanthus sonchifolius]